jgi:hypothetical protein
MFFPPSGSFRALFKSIYAPKFCINCQLTSAILHLSHSNCHMTPVFPTKFCIYAGACTFCIYGACTCSTPFLPYSNRHNFACAIAPQRPLARWLFSLGLRSIMKPTVALVSQSNSSVESFQKGPICRIIA